MLKRSLFSAAIVFVIAISVLAQTATPSMKDADALFQNQKWQEAVSAYSAITAADPAQGLAWYRLGFALNSLGKYEEGAQAFQKAVDIGHRPESMYGLAHSYALMKDKDRAFEWVTKAIENNLPQPRRVRFDPSLAILRDDPRFAELLTLVDRKAHVCMNTPEYRQFDFWVGDWQVLNKAGQQVGTNNVVALQSGCIIEENWVSGAGGTGQSFNFYNPVTHKWHQSYMDSDGGNWMMDGEFKDGAMRFEGAIYTPSGKTMVKVTFFNLGDRVRQLAETSNDQGQTWITGFDGMYVRKK